MARKTFNVLFFIKKARLLKNGEAPVCMRITVNGCMVDVLVKRSCPVNLWNQAKENSDKILDPSDKILDNQDLAFLLKVSFRTLQRYRASGKLPYFMISHKTYYRAADIRVFIQENADCKTYERFKKENQLDKQTEANQGG